MEEPKKHIDDLVATHSQKRAELQAIVRDIAASSTLIAVAFVDLTGSTQMKQDYEPEEWLGYVYEFIQHVDKRAKDADGSVVKRIGDELMITFKSVQASELFVESLITDKALQMFRYRIALDFGSAYHFRFIESLVDDPYGPVVDRCARIAKYAGVGIGICTGEYRKQLANHDDYASMGSFALRGFREPEALFARSLVAVDTEAYLKPLINVLNEEAQRIQGYRSVGRIPTTQFIREFGEDKVRPFLAIELLNVPKLPYSPQEFHEITHGTGNITEKESEFLGYFVEWEGTFESYRKRDRSEITLILQIGTFLGYCRLHLRLPLNYLELIKSLKEGQRLSARGIIVDICACIITLNYVDIESIAVRGDA